MTIPLLSQPMFIRNLSISTNVRLHPEFVAAPRAFARRHKVNLADDVFAETDFKRAPDDPGSGKRIEKSTSNIHLVRHGAIRLFTERDAGGDWVRSIDINPSMLLYEAKRYVLAAGDLPLSLSKLRNKVSPLLADPLDARHIVPGLVRDEDPVAAWGEVDSEFLFPGIQIPCLHGLSHPSTGPAEGATRKRIQLGDKKDDCVIRIKEATWEVAGPSGTESILGVRVRLILKGRKLTVEFGPFGTTALVNDTRRLVAFPTSAVAHVHQAVMSQLEGDYLPVPPEWASMGKAVTHAKAMALLSALTPIPLEELRAMDEEVRHPSPSTRKRLKKDVAAAAACLKPVPLSSLFRPEAYATQATGATPLADVRIDPLVAAVYGSGVSVANP